MPVSLAEIPYPQIDPVIFEVLGISVRWYGLAYVFGFTIAWILLRRLAREGILPLAAPAVSDLLFATMLGLVVGARLGYALFYKPGHYLAHPEEIIAIWKGGLSFHGGLAGVGIALVIFARRRRLSILRVMDACVLVAPPGIFLVRIANFINGELWGRPTDLPWAMVFPDPEAGGIPRHPSQLYEALLEGALLLAVLWSVRKAPAFRAPGALTAVFLIGYGSLRFVVEFARAPDAHLGLVLGTLSLGQVLCLTMIVLGTVWLWTATSRARQGGSPPASE